MEEQKIGTPALNLALAKAKADFPAVVASRRVEIPTSSGRKIGFTYAELEAIADAVTPVLSANELAIAHQLTFVGNKLVVKTTLRHSSGEQIESVYPLPEEKVSEKTGDTDQKTRGAAISYARRYNVICLLDINAINPNSEEWDTTKRRLAQDLKGEMRQLQDKRPSVPPVGKPERTTADFFSQINRPMVMQEIDSLMSRKKITVQQAKAECMQLFGAESRDSLSDRQLIELRDRFSAWIP